MEFSTSILFMQPSKWVTSLWKPIHLASCAALLFPTCRSWSGRQWTWLHLRGGSGKRHKWQSHTKEKLTVANIPIPFTSILCKWRDKYNFCIQWWSKFASWYPPLVEPITSELWLVKSQPELMLCSAHVQHRQIIIHPHSCLSDWALRSVVW